MLPNNAYEFKLDSSIYDKVCGLKKHVFLLTVKYFIVHERYLLTPNKINNIVDFREKFSSPCFKQLYWNLIKNRRFIGFYLFKSHLNIKMHSAPILMVLLTSSDINTPFY